MKTYFTNEIKNPYCSKGEFLWKHNDDTTLGKLKPGKVIVNKKTGSWKWKKGVGDTIVEEKEE